jgi:hypothetical protein
MNKANRFRLWVGVSTAFAVGMYYDDMKVIYKKYIREKFLS